jgi:hypothetical protein
LGAVASHGQYQQAAGGKRAEAGGDLGAGGVHGFVPLTDQMSQQCARREQRGPWLSTRAAVAAEKVSCGPLGVGVVDDELDDVEETVDVVVGLRLGVAVGAVSDRELAR